MKTVILVLGNDDSWDDLRPAAALFKAMAKHWKRVEKVALVGEFSGYSLPLEPIEPGRLEPTEGRQSAQGAFAQCIRTVISGELFYHNGINLSFLTELNLSFDNRPPKAMTIFCLTEY